MPPYYYVIKKKKKEDRNCQIFSDFYKGFYIEFKISPLNIMLLQKTKKHCKF